MKSYWSLPFSEPRSYIDIAVDECNYSTLSMGVDPLNVVQAPAELSALYEVTKMLRTNTLPGVTQRVDKIVHVGHSYGSAFSYSFAATHPTFTDGFTLTGFSMNASFLPVTVAG
jgi:hypothetical protein